MPDTILFLCVEGDPTRWVLTAPIEPERLRRSGEPLELEVKHPLHGTLLLSMRHAGSAALFGLPPGSGWIPSDAEVPSPVRYVASAAGPTNIFPGYQLARTVDLGQFTHDIKAAMHAGTTMEVPLGPSFPDGVLVLNGAELRFVVLALASARPGDPG
jgi:hypothetical protein